MNVLDRFQAKYVINETTKCWEWCASINSNGYGTFRLDGETLGAHCVSHLLFKGPYSNQVLHSCDNRRCVNPDHLFDGTQSDNMKDMVAKGRRVHSGLKGSRHPCARLTEEDVVKIRESTLPMQALADQFGLTNGSIRNIRARRSWRHV